MKIYSFQEFLNEQKINESQDQLITEAFNSSIIQDMVKNKKGGIGKEFFDALSKMGIAASEITNADLLTIQPSEAEKYTKQNPTHILIYYSSTEKTNPFTSESWYRKIEANVVLAVVKGKYYMGLKYSKFASKGGKAVYTISASGDQSKALGRDNKGGGKYDSGLNTLKKMAEVSDVVYVINPDDMPSTKDLLASRVESKKGAQAFKDDKQFKQENMARYEAILRERASKDDIDGLVKEAIDKMTSQIHKAMTDKNVGQYGDIIVGANAKGRNASMKDVAYHMSKILDDYNRYVQYTETARKSEERHGTGDDYYKREAASFAKKVKDACLAVDTFSYIW